MERVLEMLSTEQHVDSPAYDSEFQKWCSNGCEKAELIIQGAIIGTAK